MAQGNTCASSTDRAIQGRGWSEPTNIRASAREFALATPSDGFVARKNEPGGVDQRGELASRPNESYRRLSVTKGVIRHVVRAVDSRIDLPMYAPSPLDIHRSAGRTAGARRWAFIFEALKDASPYTRSGWHCLYLVVYDPLSHCTPAPHECAREFSLTRPGGKITGASIMRFRRPNTVLSWVVVRMLGL
jgi:hypothetical protein